MVSGNYQKECTWTIMIFSMLLYRCLQCKPESDSRIGHHVTRFGSGQHRSRIVCGASHRIISESCIVPSARIMCKSRWSLAWGHTIWNRHCTYFVKLVHRPYLGPRGEGACVGGLAAPASTKPAVEVPTHREIGILYFFKVWKIYISKRCQGDRSTIRCVPDRKALTTGTGIVRVFYVMRHLTILIGKVLYLSIAFEQGSP